MNHHAVFDCELLGVENPVFLVCVYIIETDEKFAFWHGKKGHTAKLEAMLQRDDRTWVGFNSENFDRPLIAAAVEGHDELNLVQIASTIIDNGMRSWQTYKQFRLEFLDYDHIDLIETAPGLMIPLNAYAGRMAYPTMQDMPFPHTTEITTPKMRKEVEKYCFNDCGVTAELFQRLRVEIDLRIQLGKEYGLDLRSKSDAQCAEAILKSRVGITGGNKHVPRYIRYTAPDFIQIKNPRLQALIDQFEEDEFHINRGNGSPIESDWMTEPVAINKGRYKIGLGGLHSQHDIQKYIVTTEERALSDFDVAGYYPKTMMIAGLIPNLGGNKGELFLHEYEAIYERRLKAKHDGNKQVSNTLKILLNGTFGKLGSIYCSFYSPDLLIAVTITGQLNLLCLIDELEKIKGVEVESANTDGIMVSYPVKMRERLLKVFQANSKRTDYEYEETPYRKVALKDVNNYFAIGTNGKVKAKGLYASSDPKVNPLYLMKNPTMQVCSDAVAAYLSTGADIEEFIRRCDRPQDFMAIRGVAGGGVQHPRTITIDDWELDMPGLWVCANTGKKVKRKSRPDPLEIGEGGTPFGRVARWYMTTEKIPPITSVKSGNQVAKTEGARLCMELPSEHLPSDLDYAWYIAEAYAILNDVGCPDPRLKK